MTDVELEFAERIVSEQGPASVLVGAYLRHLRVGQGKLLRHSAAAARLSVSEISRMETGLVRLNERHVVRLMRTYGAGGCEQLRCVRRLLSGSAGQLPHTACDYLPGRMVRLTAVERQAVSLRSFNGLFVPGLLQVPEYTRALLQGSPALLGSPDNGAVLGRVVPFGRGPMIEAVLDESILWRAVGGAATMADQLAHLDEAIEQDAADLRVARFNACVGGRCTHLARLTFHGRTPPLFCSESSVDVLYSNGTESAAQERFLDDAFSRAEPPDRSRELLAEARARFRQEAVRALAAHAT